MGKWDDVLKNTPKLGEEASGREKVAAAKAGMLADPDYKASAIFLAHQYCALRDQKDQLDDELSKVNAHIAAITELMDAQFDADGASSLKLDNGHGVSLYYEPWPKVEDREALRVWWSAQGLDAKLQIPHQTLGELMRSRLEKGEELMPGVGLFKKVRVRRT